MEEKKENRKTILTQMFAMVSKEERRRKPGKVRENPGVVSEMIYKIRAGTSFSISGSLICFTAYVVITIGKKYDMINTTNTPQPAIMI